MYIKINTNRLNGLKEYLETGYITNNGEGFAIFGDDISALDTMPYKNGVFYPQEIRTVGYADWGEGHTTLIFMCGRDDSIEIGAIDDNYFLDCFHIGMTRDEIKEELAEMILEEFENCDGISIDDIYIEKLKDSIDHPIGFVDKYLNNGEFELTEESLEQIDEPFYVSYKVNGVYQGIIVNAPSDDIARECFLNSIPDAELLGYPEAVNSDFKPGTPELNAYKYYKVEISHMASMGLTSGNTYTYWADKMPDYETVNMPMVDIHCAYFKDPVEAEDYRQKCLAEMGVINEKVLLDDVIRDSAKQVRCSVENETKDRGIEL